MEDPIDFIETFGNTWKLITYLRLDMCDSSLCLDRIDNQWLVEWEQSQLGRSPTKNQINDDFISHFKSPNSAGIWQDQIRNLKVKKEGIQRYTDLVEWDFIFFCKKNTAWWSQRQVFPEQRQQKKRRAPHQVFFF